jgi:hypothetical protein
MGNCDAMSPKKYIQGPCNQKKQFKSQKSKSRNSKKKSELKTANKTSNGIGRFIHDTSCQWLIRHVTG